MGSTMHATQAQLYRLQLKTDERESAVVEATEKARAAENEQARQAAELSSQQQGSVPLEKNMLASASSSPLPGGSKRPRNEEYFDVETILGERKRGRSKE